MKTPGIQVAALWLGVLGSLLAAALLYRLGSAGPSMFASHMAAHLLLSLVTPPLLLAALDWWPGVSAWQVPAWLGFLALNLVTVLVHLPGLNRTLMSTPALHPVEGAAFVASGLLFWAAVRRGAQAGSEWSAVGLLAARMAACALLGAAITFSRGVYLGSPTDVTLGGVLMWVGGGAVYMVWGMAMVTRALRRPAPHTASQILLPEAV